MDDLIYLDNNATTRTDPRVLEVMMPFLTSLYGNASSRHSFGLKISQNIKEARAQVAELIGSESNEIVFTSGATEAVNLALSGLLQNDSSEVQHIVTVSTEHPAVLDTCKHLETIGVEVTYLPVLGDGLLDLDVLKNSIKENTVLISVMMANNETGVIQPINEIADIAHAKGILFMTDATQAAGKIPIQVDELGIDLMAFSAHKFYGPKGIGALFVRNRRPRKVKLNALLYGGGHEKGIRSGTLNAPSIVGFGKACEIAKLEMASYSKLIQGLRDKMESELLKIKNSMLNGNLGARLYNVCNITFKGVDADAMIVSLKDIALSNGSACSSSSMKPSHVLKAMGLTDEDAFSTLRFSLGKFNTKQEVDLACSSIAGKIQYLRSMIST